jgi:phage terminase large subunit
MATVTIPYKPRNWANILHSSLTRWIIMVLHRRAGKTTAVLNHLQRDALRIPESQFAYIAPTYKQAKRVAWDIVKRIASPIPGVKFNESELTAIYPNGSKLILVGSDNPDALRGLALWGVGFDEYSQQPSNIFSEIISKALADHLGYAIFFGTPKGKNEFYRVYSKALSDASWTVIFKTIDHSLAEEQGETIENLRVALEDDRKLVAQGLMTQEEFEQEWYCSFEAAIKGAYYLKEIAEARRTNRIKPFSHDPELPVHDVWDLGTGPRIGVGLYQASGRERRMIGYLEGAESDGIPQMIAKLKHYGLEHDFIWGKHFAPHDIQATDQSTGKTRKETAAELKWEFEVVPKLSVDDGINAGRLFFARLWVNEADCGKWLDAIAQYRQEWDETRGMFLPKPYHDWTSHPADVHRYAAVIENQMTNDIPSLTPNEIAERRRERSQSATDMGL